MGLVALLIAVSPVYATPPGSPGADAGTPDGPDAANKAAATPSTPAPVVSEGAAPESAEPRSPEETRSVSPPTTGSSIGRMLLETLLVLAVVCLLAYAILRWGVRRLVGGSRSGDQTIDILARQPVGRDSSILVVRVGPRTLVVADSESGMSRLAELDDEETEKLLEAGADETASDSWVPAFLHKQGGST